MLEIIFPSLKDGENCKTFLASRLVPDPPTIFGTNQTCLPTPRFAQILPSMQTFPNHWSMQIFLPSGIGSDILMTLFEGYIILFILVGWLLLNFYLKWKKKFSVRSFTEINSFISFHIGILSITKKHYKMQVSTR